MRHATLCFPIAGPRILLGLKKRGFGAGKWNGFGGKVAPGESIEAATRREMLEECGLAPLELQAVGRLRFEFRGRTAWDQLVHVFLAPVFLGRVQESGEMRPAWYHHDEIPYQSMWEDDALWLPRVLQGRKVVGTFEFDLDGDQMLSHALEEVERLRAAPLCPAGISRSSPAP